MDTISSSTLGDGAAVAGLADWRHKLAYITDTVRRISTHTDPQTMVREYRAKMAELLPTDRMISLSRRGLDKPRYRITRSSLWEHEPNPWTQGHLLPVFEGGLLGDLIYSDEPRLIDNLRVPSDDPAAEHLDGQRSLIAIPLFDQGTALNMVVLMRKDPRGFRPEEFPDLVLASNHFGRATQTLVLSQELRRAYDEVDNELKVVAEMQRSLLPAELPHIPTMQLATHYQTSRRAGGDYYDFFPLPDDQWGILIADVSGHGTPAAVVMAITHSIAHADPEPPCCPATMLARMNRRLCEQYTQNHGTFVTAFYGVYNARTRELTYASAGHNPPRVKRCQDGSIFSLDRVGGLPLGIVADERYEPHTQLLTPGDQIIFYTDGITEAQDDAGRMFGTERLDAVLGNCMLYASDLIQTVLDAIDAFTGDHPPDDDRTLLVAKIS